MADLTLQGLESDAKALSDSLSDEARGVVPEKWYYLFQMHSRILRGDNERAEELFLAIEPDLGKSLVDVLLLGGHAKILASRNDPHSWDAASVKLLAALDICPDDPIRVKWGLVHTLGYVESSLQRYAQSEKAYRDAIALIGNEAYCSVSYSNLGVVQFKLGLYDDARASFAAARELDSEDRYGFDDNNLGFLNLFLARECRDFVPHSDLPKLIAEAEEVLTNGAAKHPRDAVIAYNQALLAWTKANLPEAESEFRRAWELHVDESVPGSDALAGSLTSLMMRNIVAFESQYTRGETPAVDRGLKPAQLGAAQAARAFIRNVSFDSELYIPSLLQALSFKTERLTRSRTIDTAADRNQLTILRRWNSYTPFVPGPSPRRGRGGGYLLSWNGVGIAIDPGHDFIENLLSHGFSLADVNVIIVTHAHLDHVMDLDPLLTLLHERSEIDGITQEPVDLMLNVGCSMKELSWLANLPDSTVGSISILYPEKEVSIRDGITLRTTKAFHDEIISKRYCIGLVFDLSNHGDHALSLAITSDTRWDDRLIDYYSNCDILVAHVGSVDFREAAAAARLGLGDGEYRKFVGEGRTDPEQKPVLDEEVVSALQFKDLDEFRRLLVAMAFTPDELYRKQHLGFSGVYKLARSFNGNLMVMSEFGEELSCFRSQIAQSLQATGPGTDGINVNTPILTGDIGLQISLPGTEVKCDVCRQFVPLSRIKEKCLVNRGMVYYCQSHSAEELRSHLRFTS